MYSFFGKQLGNYQVERELARGGFGTVYLARHTLLTDRLVAIKVLHDVHLNTREERDAFLQEAQFLDQLKHPFILPLLDVGIHQEAFPYLIMEYAAPGSLRRRLDRQSSRLLPVAESLTMLSQIGQALQYAHQQTPAIIHRDLKPENILFNQRGEALLADFGIATILSTASIRLTSSTGTPAYMAPEQFRGQVSRESDQYALGCVAYELLTGQRPFSAGDFIAMGFKHATEDPIPLRQHNPDLPAHVEAAVLKAMAKQREDRHADVAAFLAAFHAGPTVISEPPRKPPPSSGKLPPERSSSTPFLPISSGQEREIEEFERDEDWAKAAWKRAERNDVPSSWHVIRASSGCWTIIGSIIGLGILGGIMGFVCAGGAVGVFAILLSIYDLLTGSSFSWFDHFMNAGGALVIVGGGPLLGLFVGVLGGGWVGTHPGPLVVLMPDGFLSLPSSNIKPGAIIRYRNVEQMRFERDKGNLVVTMTPSFLYEINLARFDQSPHLLAQRVQEAYTRFRASGVTQSDSARQKKRPEALDLDMAAFLAEIQEGTATFLRYASAPSEKRPVGEAWANKDADKRWAGIWSKGIVPATWHVVKARRDAGDRFVLMPDGLIDLKSRLYGCSCLLINYKDVEQMRFESDKGKLVVTWSSSPWTYEIDLTGHDVAPHLIASRVQEAYTSCKVGISRA